MRATVCTGFCVVNVLIPVRVHAYMLPFRAFIFPSFDSTIRVDIMVASTQVQITTVQELIDIEVLLYVLAAMSGILHETDTFTATRHAEFYYIIASSGNVRLLRCENFAQV